MSLLIGIATSAKPEKVPMEAVCDDLSAILEVLKRAGEQPLFMGKDNIYSADSIYTIVYQNNMSGTFTVILIEKQSARACVLSSGTRGMLLLPKI